MLAWRLKNLGRGRVLLIDDDTGLKLVTTSGQELELSSDVRRESSWWILQHAPGFGTYKFQGYHKLRLKTASEETRRYGMYLSRKSTTAQLGGSAWDGGASYLTWAYATDAALQCCFADSTACSAFDCQHSLTEYCSQTHNLHTKSCRAFLAEQLREGKGSMDDAVDAWCAAHPRHPQCKCKSPPESIKKISEEFGDRIGDPLCWYDWCEHRFEPYMTSGMHSIKKNCVNVSCQIKGDITVSDNTLTDSAKLVIQNKCGVLQDDEEARPTVVPSGTDAQDTTSPSATNVGPTSRPSPATSTGSTDAQTPSTPTDAAVAVPTSSGVSTPFIIIAIAVPLALVAGIAVATYAIHKRRSRTPSSR